MALALSKSPACQPVGKVGDVAGCSACGFTQVAAERNDTTVVASRGFVSVAVVNKVLHKAVTGGGALCAVLNHVENRLICVGCAELGSSVGLHKARVRDTTVGCCHLDLGTAVSLELYVSEESRYVVDAGTYLLQNCGQDETVVNKRRIGTVLNSIVNVLNLLVSEDSVNVGPLKCSASSDSRLILAELVCVARSLEEMKVVLPHILE